MPVLDDKADEIKALFAKYPDPRSAMLPLLWMVQEQERWISQDSMREVAKLLECTEAEVYEVVSFYTMFQQKPVGKYHIALCDTLACAVCGSLEVGDYLKEKHGIRKGAVTEDGRFSIEYAECIGACSIAPALLFNEDLHGNLTPDSLDALIASAK